MADLILPLDPSQRHFGGYVEAMGRQYRVSMACPQGRRGMVDLASFRCDPELSALLEARGVWDTLRARLAQTEDVEGFMAELTDVLEKVLRSCPKQDPPPAEFYSRLVSEIDAVGWSHLVSMDSLLTSVQLRERDAAGREHVFAVSLPSNYPHSPPICSVDLPTHLNLRSSVFWVLLEGCGWGAYINTVHDHRTRQHTKKLHVFGVFAGNDRRCKSSGRNVERECFHIVQDTSLERTQYLACVWGSTDNDRSFSGHTWRDGDRLCLCFVYEELRTYRNFSRVCLPLALAKHHTNAWLMLRSICHEGFGPCDDA
ncbi:unnamed protein product [Ectocarpus sp. 8 AP-2014]